MNSEKGPALARRTTPAFYRYILYPDQEPKKNQGIGEPFPREMWDSLKTEAIAV
jgi:hypothetical protein